MADHPHNTGHKPRVTRGSATKRATVDQTASLNRERRNLRKVVKTLEQLNAQTQRIAGRINAQPPGSRNFVPGASFGFSSGGAPPTNRLQAEMANAIVRGTSVPFREPRKPPTDEEVRRRLEEMGLLQLLEKVR